MKIDIEEHKKNPLMKRDEYVLSIDHSGKPTPSRQELLKEIAKEIKAKEDVIIINKIFSSPGSPVSKARIHAYGKKEDIPADKLAKMEKRKKKETPKEEAAPEEPKAEETSKEETPPAEETKQEESPKEEPAEGREGASKSEGE